MIGRRHSRQRGTFFSTFYVKILRCIQGPFLHGAAPNHPSLAISKTMEALHYRVSDFRLPSEHNLASVFIILHDLCTSLYLEVSDILSPKKL